MMDDTLPLATLPLDTQRIVEICRRNGVSMVGLFGSHARGTADEQSDKDHSARSD